jgi:hypothetical protein
MAPWFECLNLLSTLSKHSPGPRSSHWSLRISHDHDDSLSYQSLSPYPCLFAVIELVTSTGPVTALVILRLRTGNVALMGFRTMEGSAGIVASDSDAAVVNPRRRTCHPSQASGHFRPSSAYNHEVYPFGQLSGVERGTFSHWVDLGRCLRHFKWAGRLSSTNGADCCSTLLIR